MSDTRFGGKESPDDRASTLVNKLFKSDDILHENDVIRNLREVYKNDEKLMGKAHKYFVKRFNAINEHAKEFKTKLLAKYQYMDLTKIMKKAAEYAARYRMTPAEYHLFVNLIKKDHSGKFNKYTYEERTDMGKALGYEPKKFIKLNYSPEDKKFLDSIMAFYKQSVKLDKTVKVNALTYKDCDPVVINAKYNKYSDNKEGSHIIHPLLAAMFIPKISAFDERMLMTSIPYIITSIYNGDDIKDYPNKFLYDDIVTDKNQPAYSAMSPYQDLYTRSVLQAKLWEGVLQLRNGNFYHFDNEEFNEVISKYPANIFDAPDMLFAQDAGNILRRIMNAFSFNPTVVKVTKTNDKYYALESGTFKVKVDDDKKYVSIVPMINVRLPTENQERYNIKLDDNIKSSQWFTKEDDLTPIPYEQKIINSEGVLIFYVNRSYNTISVSTEEQDLEKKLLNRHNLAESTIYQNYVNSLPLMFSNVQKINDMNIKVPELMSVNGHQFRLRSVVLAESVKLGDVRIIGDTSSIIYTSDGQHAFYYNPSIAGKPYEGNSTDDIKTYSPITVATSESANDAISSNGMIYIYAEQ